MWPSILKNSFVVMIIAFLVLSAAFYVFGIGFTTSIEPDGQINRRFSYKYPLAIALIIWLLWYFVLFPPQCVSESDAISFSTASPAAPVLDPIHKGGMHGINQRISMVDWN
ncbi:Hypothetical protein MVR_LOCUS58 [uncultured virus]|nr:Hypothetical protein MVR_LOCUS58 [uncultured virus]